MQLFHASKNGITSDIKAISRKDADFGEGFYMCETKDLCERFVSDVNIKSPKIYEVDIDITDLKTYTFNMNNEWYMYIVSHLYPEKLKNYKKVLSYIKRFDQFDMLIGTITDDGLIYALNKFFENEITEEVLLKTLYSFKCDDQYVAKTEKAVRCINIENEYAIDLSTREKLYDEVKNKIDEVKEVIEKVKKECKDTKSKYFNQILEEFNN